VSETYKYTGDGQRIIATQGVTTTVYIGSYFEWHGTVTDTVKYYYAGATRVAMRVGATAPVYLMGDHLGSTSVAVNANGVLVPGSPQLYKAWGETRTGGVPTKYQYTGQFNNSELGLYYYGARWYDGTLGRFIQADTIIPNGYNSQAFDRYAYVLNNPLRFIDPSGHKDLDSGKRYYDGVPWEDRLLDKFLRDWGITITGKLSNQAKKDILEAARLAGLKFSKEIGGSPMSAFVKTHGPINLEILPGEATDYWDCSVTGNNIKCYGPPYYQLSSMNSGMYSIITIKIKSVILHPVIFH
jgi:RHS repeat-associated protein